MVASFAELASSATAVSYYEKDGYYAKNDPEHRQASFWRGAGALALGLKAHVHPKRFEEVLSGKVPGTGIQLGRKRDGRREHRPGWDLTLSAPKSVSLEGLVIGDRRVIRAHDEAVHATLDWVEREFIETRGWDPETKRRPRVKAEGLVAAGFRHLTSRDLDPQLHTHCVIANMTQNAEGQWKSVEPTALRRNRNLIGAYYRNELAWRLQANGIAITPTMVGRVPGFEIAGYERSFLDAFSGRRRAILEHLEKHGLPYTPELAQMAALHTRRTKREKDLAELVPAWRQRAAALGLRRVKGMAPGPVEIEAPDLPDNIVRATRRAPTLPKLPDEGRVGKAPRPTIRITPDPETGVLEAVARAVAHIAERRTVLPASQIRTIALGHAPGRYTLDEIDGAIARLAACGDIVATGESAFVTARAVKAERRILGALRRGRGQGEALAANVEPHLADAGLTDGQREAVSTVLHSEDIIVGVQGHAGSGKTTMLRTVKELLDERPVLGLAPSAAAARVLQREAGIQSRTLQSFLARYGDLGDGETLARARADLSGVVLAVDEASMIDTRRMEALLRIAGEVGVARVALVGDTAQLRAVDAGQPFRLLQKAGMATAMMTEVLRQKDAGLREAVARSREGEPGAAMARLGRRIREVEHEALGSEAARCWLGLAPDQRRETLLMAPTHAIRRQANRTVREGLEAEGALHGRTLVVDRLVDRRLTRVEAAEIDNWEPGVHAVFHRDHYGCLKDDVCTVSGHDDGEVVLLHPDGSERRFRPSGNASWYVRLCDTERIELKAGERIRWTRNRPAPRGSPVPDLVNGGAAEITEITMRKVRFRDAEGRQYALRRSDPQLRHLDHAYCSTVHAAQGSTARGAIAVLEAGGHAGRDLFHVELSRVSDDFLLLTDDREALVERLEAAVDVEDNALAALGIDPSEPPALDAELFEALVADWQHLREEAAEMHPATRPGYREVMARAAAFSTIEDLAPDMAAVIDSMLAEHETWRQASGLVSRLQEASRRWPELAWAGAEERSASWRGEAEDLMAQARALRANDHASPSGLAGAMDALSRTLVLDDGARFERRWQQIREAVTAERHGDPHSVAGYAELSGLGRALEGVEGLAPAHQGAVDEWMAFVSRHREAMAVFDDAARFALMWDAVRTDLPEPGAGDPGEVPGYAGLDDPGLRLLGSQEHMTAAHARAIEDWRAFAEAHDRAAREQSAALARHAAAWRAELPLDEVTAWRGEAENLLATMPVADASAARDLVDALGDAWLRELDLLDEAGRAWADRNDSLACYAPTHQTLKDRVDALFQRQLRAPAGDGVVPQAVREAVNRHIHERARTSRERLRCVEVLAEARAVGRDEGGDGWRERADRALEAIASLKADLSPLEIAAHLAGFRLGSSPDNEERRIAEAIARDDERREAERRAVERIAGILERADRVLGKDQPLPPGGMRLAREVLEDIADLEARMPQKEITARLAAMGRPEALANAARAIRDAVILGEKEAAIEQEVNRLTRRTTDVFLQAADVALGVDRPPVGWRDEAEAALKALDEVRAEIRDGEVRRRLVLADALDMRADRIRGAIAADDKRRAAERQEETSRQRRNRARIGHVLDRGDAVTGLAQPLTADGMERAREVLDAMADLKASVSQTEIDAHLAAMDRTGALTATEEALRDAIAWAEKAAAIEKEVDALARRCQAIVDEARGLLSANPPDDWRERASAALEEIARIRADGRFQELLARVGDSSALDRCEQDLRQAIARDEELKEAQRRAEQIRSRIEGILERAEEVTGLPQPLSVKQTVRAREVLKLMAGLKADVSSTEIDAHLAALGRPEALATHEREIRDAVADAEREAALGTEAARLRKALETLLEACILAERRHRQDQSMEPIDEMLRRIADVRAGNRDPAIWARVGGAGRLDKLEEDLHACVKATAILNAFGEVGREKERRERLEEFFVDITVYGRRRSMAALAARHASPDKREEMRRELLDHGRGLLARAEDLEREMPQRAMARHLEAIGMTVDALSRSKATLREGISRDENVRAAPKLNEGRGRGISM